MESLRNRINLKLVLNPIRANKLIARTTFQRFDIIEKDLKSITMTIDKVILNRFIYLSLCILDLFKITIYHIHYQRIVAMCGNKSKLAYPHKDSVVYQTETKNIYEDMANIDAFDASD